MNKQLYEIMLERVVVVITGYNASTCDRNCSRLFGNNYSDSIADLAYTDSRAVSCSHAVINILVR